MISNVNSFYLGKKNPNHNMQKTNNIQLFNLLNIEHQIWELKF